MNFISHFFFNNNLNTRSYFIQLGPKNELVEREAQGSLVISKSRVKHQALILMITWVSFLVNLKSCAMEPFWNTLTWVGPSSVQKNCGRVKTVDQTKNLENLMKIVCFGKGFDPATSEYLARPQFYPCHISLNHLFLPSENFSLWFFAWELLAKPRILRA